MNWYDDGELVIVDTAPQGFQNEAGTNVDPSVVEFESQFFGQVTPTTLTYGVDAAVTRTGTGQYRCTYDTSGKGGRPGGGGNVCTVKIIGDPDGTPTPTCQATMNRQFGVKAPPF